MDEGSMNEAIVSSRMNRCLSIFDYLSTFIGNLLDFLGNGLHKLGSLLQTVFD